MRDRVIPGRDESAARARAQPYFDRMREGCTERDDPRRPSSELFPPWSRSA
jgi:hypothetical protein